MKITTEQKRIIEAEKSKLDSGPKYSDLYRVKILNGPLLNQLLSVNSASVTKVVDCITNESRFVMKNGNVYIADWVDGAKVRLQVATLLDFLIIKFTKTNDYKNEDQDKLNTLIEFSLDEFILALGYENPHCDNTKRHVRKNLKKFLKELSKISLEGYEKRGKDHKYFEKMPIIIDYKIAYGVVSVKLGISFALYLITSYISEYPLSLLHLDNRSRTCYLLGKKLVLHYSMKSNQRRDTNKIISVEKLLQATYSIPAIEKVREGNGSWGIRIQEPLEKALDKLCDMKILKYWQYSNSNKQILRDDQLAPEKFYDFKNQYIVFELY